MNGIKLMANNNQVQLLGFLLEQREALKAEDIFLYLHLNTDGMLFVGFEYKIICISYLEKTPYISSMKKCSARVNIDNLTEDKHKKFMKSYEKYLNEIRNEQTKQKGYVIEMKMKIENLLGANV